MVKKLILLWLLTPLYLNAWKMESGTVSLLNTNNASWVNVTFQQSYSTPPLIFTMPTEKGADPVTIRVQNITTSGFELLQVEPSGNDGPHVAMSVNYIAIDLGVHFLPDGTRLVASKYATQTQQGNIPGLTTGWDDIAFATSFVATPLVLATVQTTNNEVGNIPSNPSVPFLTVAIRNVDANGFQMALERAEAAPGDVNNSETIAYLAIESNKQGTLKDLLNAAIQYETMLTGQSIKGWDNGSYNFPFINSYSTLPNVVGSQQTRVGGNGGWLRNRNTTTATEVKLAIDEDKYNDPERTHLAEIGGLVIFEKDFAFDSATYAAVIEYRMDECFWLGTGTFDVANSAGINDAETYNSPQTDAADAKVCSSGAMGAQGYLQSENLITLGADWSYALWVKFPLDSTNHDNFVINGTDYFYHALGSIVGTGDMPALLIENGGVDIAWELYDATGTDYWADLPDDLALTNNGWHHFTFVQTAGEISLYLDGVFYNKITGSISGDVEGLLTAYDNRNAQSVGSHTDELKLYDYVLSPSDVNSIFQNENSGNNFDGSPRVCKTCTASITAGSWELIGVPADLRTEANTSIAKILDDDIAGIYGIDWRIYTREYSDVNNSSWYTYLSDVNTPLVFGKAYWLGSKNAENWDVNDMQAVDYNSTNSACTAATCIEIDVKSVSVDFTLEPDDGTGPYRYYMTGFTGKAPVDWADCRFIVNGVAYTPSDAETAGYVNKQIWQYNPGATGVNANGYTTCDDITPGSCKLIPYEGFWIELNGPSKAKSIQLLIPKS